MKMSAKVAYSPLRRKDAEERIDIVLITSCFEFS